MASEKNMAWYGTGPPSHKVHDNVHDKVNGKVHDKGGSREQRHAIQILQFGQLAKRQLLPRRENPDLMLEIGHLQIPEAG